MLIKNARILTMADGDYEKGDVRIHNGKITDIGLSLEATQGEDIIDASGLTVMPGMVDAHCHVGINGYGLGPEGSGSNEMVQPMTANLCALDGINPNNSIFDDSRNAGVTTICTGPGSANLLGGTCTIIKTYGTCVDDMVVRREAALKAAFGENPKRCYGRMMQMAPYTRMGSVAMLRQRFYDAQAYEKAKEAARKQDKPQPPVDMQLEAIAKVLRREMPLKCHTHRADDMFSAIRFAREFDIKITLDHCTSGKKIAAELARANVPLIVGPIICERYKVEMNDISGDIGAALAAEGIEFAICTDAPVVPQRLLPMTAGYMVANGLSADLALRAITINPAKILEIDDRVGSIEPGKDADLVFYDGHPFDLTARVRRVMIDGKTIFTQ